MDKRSTVRFRPPANHAPWYALGAGGMAVLGLPSGPTPLAMIFGLMIFLILLPGLTVRRGAWLGFLFGLSYFSFGFSWLLTSLHDYGGISLWLAVVMLLGLSAFMALYPAMFAAILPLLLAEKITIRSSAQSAENSLTTRDQAAHDQQLWLMPLAAPALWALTEWLRASLFGGFAWNLLGYGWDRWLPMIQIADLGGVFLLSWFMMFVASMLVVLWLHRSVWRKSIKVFIVLAGTLVCLFLYGEWRLDTLKVIQQEDHPDAIRVAIVHGNIEQQLKWDPAHQDETVSDYLALTRSLPRGLDLVVWPETAMAFYLQAYPNRVRQINRVIDEIQAPIITGVPMTERDKDGQWRYYNSMVMLDGGDFFSHRYDKYHLVPFGEFIPLRRFAPSTFKKFTEGTEDFSSGSGPVPMLWDKGAIGPLICYEAIFPDEVRTLAETGVKWLVNITNDAWFGQMAKPQHLAMVRLRAVENRLPMIRAANAGISAVFDHLGRELGRIEADRAGTVVVTLPPGAEESFYRRSGPLWLWIWVGLVVIAGLLGPLRMVIVRRIARSPASVE